jgi:hypothetical protein
MIANIGLVFICIFWIATIIKMKKNEFNRYALLFYAIGALLLVIDGLTVGAFGITETLNSITVIASIVVLSKIWNKK